MAGKINIKRWVDVVFLGFASFVVVVLLSQIPFLKKQLVSWAILISSLEAYIQIGIYALLIFLIVLILIKFYVVNPQRLKNIKFSLYYPSITASILICGILLLVYTKYFSIVTMPFIYAYIVFFSCLYLFLLFLLCSCDASIKRSDAKPSDESITVPDWVGKNEQYIDLYKWIVSEKPIYDEKDDKSNRKSYAKRVADKLRNKEVRNHICLVGPFGSGKTSIWNMVSKNLDDDDKIFVPVDGWGRSVESVAAQIIDEIIYALSEYVDCAAIKTVPGEYMDSLSGADFIGANSLAKILTPHQRRSPQELIQEIDNILVSIGKQLVVVLEDFDRNPGCEQGANEIAALLDRLRSLKSIDFILCVSAGQGSSIISRISTHREDVVSFDSRDSIEGLIDLMIVYAKAENIELILLKDIDQFKFSQIINRLISTPRELKYILRRSLSAWNNLAGEVNCYDLIAINALRYSHPEFLDFVNANFSRFIDAKGDFNLLRSDYVSIFDKDNTDSIFNAADFLFSPKKINFQRLNNKYGRRYFDKILSESMNSGSTDKEFVFNLKKLNMDNSIDVGDKSEILEKIVLSDELTLNFVNLFVYFLGGDSDEYISKFNFNRFIIARCHANKDIFVRPLFADGVIKNYIRDYLDASYFNDILALLIRKNIKQAFDFCISSKEKNKDTFVDAFTCVYLKDDSEMTLDAFKCAAKDCHDNTLKVIFEWLKSSSGLCAYTKLLIQSFIAYPEYMAGEIAAILNEFVFPEGLVISNKTIRENGLWVESKSELILAFSKISDALDANYCKDIQEKLKQLQCR